MRIVQTDELKADEIITFKIKQIENQERVAFDLILESIISEGAITQCHKMNVSLEIENNTIKLIQDAIGVLTEIKTNTNNPPTVVYVHTSSNIFKIAHNSKSMLFHAESHTERDIIVAILRNAIKKGHNQWKLKNNGETNAKTSLEIRLSECEGIIRSQNNKIKELESKIAELPRSKNTKAHNKYTTKVDPSSFENIKMQNEDLKKKLSLQMKTIKYLESKSPIIIEHLAKGKRDESSVSKESDGSGFQASKYESLLKENKKIKSQLEYYIGNNGGNNQSGVKNEKIKAGNYDVLLSECQKTISEQCKKMEEYKRIIENINAKKQSTSILNYESIVI
jgi:hypothetical protein